MRVTWRARLRPAAFRAVALLIIVNSALAVRGTWLWVRPLDRFAGEAWPEYGRQPYTAMAAPYLELADELRGVETVGFINGYGDAVWEQRMMAQSMLAPTLITMDARPRLVIAAFPTDRALDSFLAAGPPPDGGRLAVRLRFSPGMALLERVSEVERPQR